MLGRFGIDLVAERIEGERAVVDLLDYDVRFGQGFLFSPPRPLRTDTPPAPPRVTAPEPQPAPPAASARMQGMAALVRRSAGPA
jgi:cyclic-di-GMP phosphodiesterase TipF (flagellum assembly factor)